MFFLKNLKILKIIVNDPIFPGNKKNFWSAKLKKNLKFFANFPNIPVFQSNKPSVNIPVQIFGKKSQQEYSKFIPVSQQE